MVLKTMNMIMALAVGVEKAVTSDGEDYNE
jgi:hypothetical protein